MAYERAIAGSTGNRNGHKVSGMFHGAKAEEAGWPLKCEYGVGEVKNTKKKELSVSDECDFIPEMPDLRKKRTV